MSVSIQHRVITKRVFHENYTGGAYQDYDVIIVCWNEAMQFNEAIQVNRVFHRDHFANVARIVLAEYTIIYGSVVELNLC